MNHNRNVVVFTLVSTSILLAYSLYAAFFQPPLVSLNNISIVSDVLMKKDIAAPGKPTAIIAKTDTVIADSGPQPPRALNKYTIPKNITAFYTDKALSALPATMHKLLALRDGKKGKVRIAWLGDSFIEGDQLTKTFRRRMQDTFGGCGVGFVPITSVTNDGFRSTLSQKWTGDWKEENFKTKELSGPLYLSGRLYYAADGVFTLKDLSMGKDSIHNLEKSLICGYFPGSATITVNGQPRQYTTSKKLNRIVLDSSTGHNVTIAIQNDKLPVYGVSMEPQTGVVVDNFSFRGISGEELTRLDTGFLRSIQEYNSYDLVVLEYGVNVLYRPDNTDFSWHKRNMTKMLQKLHSALPNVEFLIISTSDRGFRYGEESRTATGLDNLVKTQAELAFDNNMAFFNMFASMGGAGTIVRWADSLPTLAGHDYVHPNGRGAEILGNLFFDCFMKDYNKVANPAMPEKGKAPVEAKESPATSVEKKEPQPKEAEQAKMDNRYSLTTFHSITDKKTNLEWYVGDDRNYTWQEACDWAKELAVGKGGWRLPTAEEVMTLYDPASAAGQGYIHTDGKAYPAKINPVFSGIGHGSWVWTSIELGEEKAFSVNLNRGQKVVSLKSKTTYPVRVLCVRKFTPSKPSH